MKLGRFIIGVCALGAALGIGSASAQDGGPPPPTSGELLVSDLQSAQGSTVGPDGALYVGEAGTGEGTAFETPEGEVFPGSTGRISRIDPETGVRNTIADGLPSVGFGDGSATGIVDVAYMGDDLYFLTTGGGAAMGLPDSPNGVYRIEGDDFELVADIGGFNEDNPVDFEDAGPSGNPFAIQVRGSEFIVSDGNYNRVLRVTTDGDISILASYGNVVPTGLEAEATGPVYMTNLGPGPFAPADGKIVRIALPSGSTTTVASGFPQMIDVEFGQGGQLYGLNFGDPADEAEGLPPPTGKLLRVNTGTGVMTAIVDGLAAPTSLEFIGDDAFVLNLLGQVWKIEGVSALQALPVAAPTSVAPPPLVATPTRATGIAAPDTGSGPSGGGSDATLWFAVAVIGALGVSATGAALAFKRG